MDTPKHQGLSIFVRILLVFMSVNILTSAILILVAYWFSSSSIEKRTKESISHQINTLRDNFENQYGTVLRNTLHSLANSTALEDYLLTPEAEKLIVVQKVEHLMVDVTTNYPGIQGLKFVDATGNVRISVFENRRRKESINLNDIDPQNPPHSESLRVSGELFRQLASTPLLLKSGYMEWFIPPREISVMGPFLDENDTYSSIAGVSKLDLESRSFGGVLLVRQNFEDFFALLREMKLFEENLIWVFDAEGRVLQHPQTESITFNPKSHLPKEFQANVLLMDVDEGLLAVQDLSITPGKTFIRIAASIPKSLLLKDFRPAITFFSLVLLTSILIVLLVAAYVSRYLSKPIVHLSSAVARIASGDLNTKVAIRTTGEVRTLVKSFNRMTADLRTSIAAREESMKNLVAEVAERKRAEHELSQRNQELKDARATAEAANVAKSQFLANMSHEIRTPLNGVLGMADLLQNSNLNERQRHYCGAIVSSGRALRDLLGDILDLAKIEAGKVELEREDFDLSHLLDELNTVFHSMAAARGNTLNSNIELDENPQYRGDALRLRQVLTNLLSNSIKFTENGQIDLEAQTLKQRPDDPRHWVRIIVRDNGIGMKPEAIEKLFQPFEQADRSTTREYGGTGLGLAIVKHLVNLMGGNLDIASAPGLGTECRVELPFSPVEKNAPHHRADVIQKITSGENNYAPKNILLVEDNAINQEVARSMLLAAGHHVDIANDGAEAVLLHQDNTYDCILMDCQMPVMDGFEATRRIRENETASGKTRIPIIALTANAMSGDKERCLAAGMDHFLSKPFDTVSLLNAVAKGATPADVKSRQEITPPVSHGTGLDPAALEILIGINNKSPGFLNKATRLFLNDAPKMISTVANVSPESAKEAQRAAHTLKSNSQSFGAIALSELAAQAESAAREGRLDTVRELSHALHLEFTRVVDLISRHPALTNKKPNTPDDKTQQDQS